MKQEMMSYSKKRETMTKMKYKTNMVMPRPLFIFHLEHAMAMITNMSMPKSSMMEHAMPSVNKRTNVNTQQMTKCL